jgi:DNA (cytosine-5)-methyltransferase 1
MELTHIDLFSGIGGFALAARWAGLKTVQFVEIDPFCQKVLQKNFPGVPIHEDIKTFQWTGDSPFILTGGFPCQDLSHAGKGKGFEGSRSSLYREIIRTICDTRPKFVIMENVSALLTGNNGQWFGRLLSDLANVGYDAEWHCIPASAIGCEHHRNRVWIVAYPNEVGRKICDITITRRPLSWDWMDSMERIGWTAKPGFLRMDDGIPKALDASRIAALGNSIVPQVAYEIMKAIKQIEGNV